MSWPIAIIGAFLYGTAVALAYLGALRRGIRRLLDEGSFRRIDLLPRPVLTAAALVLPAFVGSLALGAGLAGFVTARTLALRAGARHAG